MTDPTNDREEVATSPGYNLIADALADALTSEWWVESEADAVGRAYHGDPRNTDPKDVVAVQIRTDYDAPYSVSSSVWSERRGMHDLAEHDEAETLQDAVDVAVAMAEDLTDESSEASVAGTAPSEAGRDEVGWAVVGIHVDAGEGEHEDPIPIAVFPDAEWSEVGDLVADRIEAASDGAWSAVERPEPGETRRVGLVAWGEDGKPTRFYTENHLAVYDERGVAEAVAVEDLYPAA
ncbi:MAG: hypothetical protein ACI9CA_000446 [Natronomonas sp.]|jgi:hypothetical protein